MRSSPPSIETVPERPRACDVGGLDFLDRLRREDLAAFISMFYHYNIYRTPDFPVLGGRLRDHVDRERGQFLDGAARLVEPIQQVQGVLGDPLKGEAVV